MVASNKAQGSRALKSHRAVDCRNNSGKLTQNYLRLTATTLGPNKVHLSCKAVPGRNYETLYANGFEYVFHHLPVAGFPQAATSAERSFDHAPPAKGPRTRLYLLRFVP